MMHWLTRFPRWTALMAGAASATGFAPLGLWPVTLLCLALLMQLITQAGSVRRAFLIGWLFGVGHFTIGNNWIATAFTYQAKMPGWLGWIAVVALALYLAVYPALASAMAWAIRRRVGAASVSLPFILAFAGCWIITEWLRSWVFTGFAWNPLSAVAPWAAAPTIWIGTYGQSGLIIIFSGALIALLASRWKAALLLATAPILLIGCAWLATMGEGVVAGINAKGGFAPRTPITIVQPNIPQDEKWDERQRAVNFQKLARLSPRQPGGAARLLLWPEAAVPDYLEAGYPLYWYDEPPEQARARIASLLSAGDVLLTGAVKLEPTRDGMDVLGARNSVFALAPDATLGPRYDKAHLVPYGEYLPMRALLEPLGISRLAPGALDFWPGPGARTLDLSKQGFGRVGVQICYEIIFSGQVVDRANRPDFLFNPSNDAWFGGWGPPQHLAQARLRAIEEGLPVVRATPTGISAVIDADGRVLRAIPMHRAGRIDMNLPPPHAPTPFARYGNALPLLFAAVLIIAAFLPLARRRTAR